jgi:PhnB protein
LLDCGASAGTESGLEEETNMSQAPQAPVVPYLSLDDANAAIEFYKRAFGAQLVDKHLADDGKRVMHASLLINGGVVMLADEFPEFSGGRPPENPKALGGSGVTIHLDLKDADTLWNQAVAAGATVLMPLADQFWGDRYGMLADPFGHKWALFTHKPKPQS